MEGRSDVESYEFDDEEIARFFSEADVSSEDEDDQHRESPCKKRRQEMELPSCIESGEFGKIPPDLFRNILKFLSSEDLSSCAKVCQYLRQASSEPALWRRLYRLRWGSGRAVAMTDESSSTRWKQLYFERDEADVAASMQNAPQEFKAYYMQIEVAKRSEAPPPSQVRDDLLNVDQFLADQVSAWRRSHKLADNYIGNHTCSGEVCSLAHIGNDVYICEKTGRVHVCGDACREIVVDADYIRVCTVTGRCFGPDIFNNDVEDDPCSGATGSAATEEATEEADCLPGLLGRAFSMGYHGYRFRCC